MTLIFLLLLLVPGLYCLIRGWRGHRVGDEPHCVRCGYILLHLTSTQCPECGTAISAANTVTGERRRRWGLLGTGVLLLTLGGLPLSTPAIDAFNAIPWYHYKPASFVFDDLTSPTLFPKALAELKRRDDAGSLSGSNRHRLIDFALQEQAPTTLNPRYDLLEYLGSAILADHLTEKQKKQFLEQACTVTLATRPIVAEGDQVPLSVGDTRRGPTGGNYPLEFWVSVDHTQPRQDGKQMGSTTACNTGPLGNGTSTSTTNLPAGTVGKHTLESDVRITLFHGQNCDPSRSRLIGTRQLTVKTTYEIVPQDQAPKIQLLASAELRQEVLAAMKLKTLSIHKNGDLRIDFQLTDTPCDLAFAIFIQTDQGETKLGSLCVAKGKSFAGYGIGCPVPTQLPAKAKVILRPSADLAKQTLDETAIYAGELEFLDVPVTQASY